MIKKILIPIFWLSALGMAEAQVYLRTAGVRLDETSVGLSLVQRIWKPVTVEGILEFRQRDFSAVLIPRVHSKILGRRLNAFVGLGPQAGWVKTSDTSVQPYWAVSGMLGLEYKFNILPIHISYDFRPIVFFDGHPDLFGFQSGFAIRLVKKSERKAWKEKWKKWKEDAKDWFESD